MHRGLRSARSRRVVGRLVSKQGTRSPAQVIGEVRENVGLVLAFVLAPGAPCRCNVIMKSN